MLIMLSQTTTTLHQVLLRLVLESEPLAWIPAQEVTTVLGKNYWVEFGNETGSRDY